MKASKKNPFVTVFGAEAPVLLVLRRNPRSCSGPGCVDVPGTFRFILGIEP